MYYIVLGSINYNNIILTNQKNSKEYTHVHRDKGPEINWWALDKKKKVL